MARGQRIRLGVALAAAAVALAVVGAAPSSASVSGATATAKYSDNDCKALSELGDEVPKVSRSSGSFNRARLAAAATGFKETAKKVDDKKLKRSLNDLSKIYSKMAKQKNLAGAVAVTVTSGKKYTNALSTFSKASVACVTSNLTIPELPGNVTIPSLGR